MIDVYNYFTIVIIISQYYCIVDQINTASWAFQKILPTTNFWMAV